MEDLINALPLAFPDSEYQCGVVGTTPAGRPSTTNIYFTKEEIGSPLWLEWRKKAIEKCRLRALVQDRLDTVSS